MVVVATAATAALCHNTLAAISQVYEAGDRGCGRDSSAITIVAVASAMEWLQCHNSRLGLGAIVSEDAVMVVAAAKPSDQRKTTFHNKWPDTRSDSRVRRPESLQRLLG